MEELSRCDSRIGLVFVFSCLGGVPPATSKQNVKHCQLQFTPTNDFVKLTQQITSTNSYSWVETGSVTHNDTQ